MKGKRPEINLRIWKLINVILVTFPYGVCWMLYYAERVSAPYHAKGNYLVIALFAVVYVAYGHVYDAFLVSIVRISELIYSQGLAAFISDGILYIVSWLLVKHLPAVWPLLLTFGAQLALSAVWSYGVHHWYFRVFPAKRTVIIYDRRQGMKQLLEEYGLDKKFKVLKVISTEECSDRSYKELFLHMDAVFLCGVHSHERNKILKFCIGNGISAYVIPRIGDVLLSGARRMHMLHLPILFVNRYNPNIEYVVLKRFFDLVFSVAALVVLFPVFLITAIAVKAEDGGPVFYKQCRLTKNGRRFFVLKFRSMRVDAEMDGVARLSTGESDSRITTVGKFIRKVRIDELPQLINILKGEMTIVGPRPERPEIAARYEKELPEFPLRLQAKAGLTGYAQVYGKYNTTPYDKLQMDLMYISKPGILEDLRIIFATVKILFIPESTQGVKEGQITAGDNMRRREANSKRMEEGLPHLHGSASGE